MNETEIDRLDWHILDALADDYESVEQIQKLIQPEILSQESIINRLEHLYMSGYVFLTLNQSFDRQRLIEEIYHTKDRKFWFGQTEIGRLAWRGFSDRYEIQ